VTTIAEAITTYLQDCKTRNLRPETIRTYRRQLRLFHAYAADAGLVNLEQVTTQTLRAYLVGLHDRGLRPASIRSVGRELKIWLNFCVAEGLITANPAHRVRLPKRDRPKPNAFTVDEVKQIIRTARTRRDRAIVLCLLDTGCRVGEFTAWTRADISDDGRVNLRAETTKTNTDRTVFLGKRSRTALTRYLDQMKQQDRVWLSERKPYRPLTVDGMKRAIQRIGANAGVKPAGPHRYRRTFATFALRNGMNLYDLAEIMGHTRIDQMKHYLEQTIATLAASHAKHSPADRLLK